MWLFGIDEQSDFDEFKDLGRDHSEADFAARYILDELGIEFEEPETAQLDSVLSKLKGKFPTTVEFSSLARKSLVKIDPRDGADDALIAWLEREEALFKRLEHTIVADRLRNGFMIGNKSDVDGFLKFSLTVQNRRKSRAGHSLEHHLNAVFTAYELQFDQGAWTEGKASPDFLFPGSKEYHDPAFEQERLTLLGSKSTCKDRWRQVLSEGRRIPKKHLITLEPAISVAQNDEMRSHLLQLILPKTLHATYKPAQQAWLMDLAGFIKHVKSRS